MDNNTHHEIGVSDSAHAAQGTPGLIPPMDWSAAAKPATPKPNRFLKPQVLIPLFIAIIAVAAAAQTFFTRPYRVVFLDNGEVYIGRVISFGEYIRLQDGRRIEIQGDSISIPPAPGVKLQRDFIRATSPVSNYPNIEALLKAVQSGAAPQPAPAPAPAPAPEPAPAPAAKPKQ